MSDFVMALCLVHKKYRPTYQTHAASICFARAWPHVELEFIQRFLEVNLFRQSD